MKSFRQIEANRRNALKSTGPTTPEGKRRSAQNAVRHGLTAETTIVALEDLEDYRAFELAVTRDYGGETAVERELVLRLASLLWRLRRATAIETGLFQIQADFGNEPERIGDTDREPDRTIALFDRRAPNNSQSYQEATSEALDHQQPKASQTLELARCFLGLSNLDSSIVERLGRYEMALWRQTRQVMFSLKFLRNNGERNRSREAISWPRWQSPIVD
jgi:hypothetical protein